MKITIELKNKKQRVYHHQYKREVVYLRGISIRFMDLLRLINEMTPEDRFYFWYHNSVTELKEGMYLHSNAYLEKYFAAYHQELNGGFYLKIK